MSEWGWSYSGEIVMAYGVLYYFNCMHGIIRRIEREVLKPSKTKYVREIAFFTKNQRR